MCAVCYVQSAKRRWFANELPSVRHDYVSHVLMRTVSMRCRDTSFIYFCMLLFTCPISDNVYTSY